MIQPQLVTNCGSAQSDEATGHFDAWQKSPLVQGLKSFVSKLIFDLIGHSESAPTSPP